MITVSRKEQCSCDVDKRFRPWLQRIREEVITILIMSECVCIMCLSSWTGAPAHGESYAGSCARLESPPSFLLCCAPPSHAIPVAVVIRGVSFVLHVLSGLCSLQFSVVMNDVMAALGENLEGENETLAVLAPR